MKKIVLASLLAAMVGGASAQVYVGGAYGITQHEVDCTGADSCDKSDTGFKIYGGFQFNPVVAAELGYINFGASKVSGAAYYPSFGVFQTDLKMKVSAVTLAAAIRGQFSPVMHGVLRLGVANVTTDVDTLAHGLASVSDSESATKAYLGLGLEYSFNKNVRGTLGADFTQGEIYGESGSVRAFNVGLQYGF